MRYDGNEYSHDLIVDEALAFVDENQDHLFFLYLPFTIPHVALQVPDDSLAEYARAFPDDPYLSQDALCCPYLPHRTPRAAYAAMITRMDRDVGRILSRLADLGLDDDTVVFFTSDNGPSCVGGADPNFFESRGPLRGRKAQVYEGGIRVPFIARWPGRIEPGSVSDLPSAFWDVMPTLSEIAGAPLPPNIDGVSILPTLLGAPETQVEHEYLYWEFSRQQVVRLGDWKGIRPADADAIELYDLATDLAETTDVAADHPDVVSRIEAIMRTGRTESALFPLRRD